MVQIATNWLVYGWSLVISFIFGIIFAMIVRWAARLEIIGQTAWAVVIGVASVLLIMIPFFSLDLVVLMFPFFVSAGTPMIIEYIVRIQAGMKRDHDEAKDLAKDLLKRKDAYK